jgi:hypothetical protein
MTPRQRILLLKEAQAIEALNGRWTQKHAAVVTGYSPAFLRNSDCPKRLEDGDGPKGKPRVFYLPSEVHAWLDERNQRARRSA